MYGEQEGARTGRCLSTRTNTALRFLGRNTRVQVTQLCQTPGSGQDKIHKGLGSWSEANSAYRQPIHMGTATTAHKHSYSPLLVRHQSRQEKTWQVPVHQSRNSSTDPQANAGSLCAAILWDWGETTPGLSNGPSRTPFHSSPSSSRKVFLRFFSTFLLKV